jgi:LPXTG-motif cell wall-anchored protein
VPAAPEEPESEVLGVVVERQLPVTGSTTLPLLQVGFGLILLGAGAVLFGRERPALI